MIKYYTKAWLDECVLRVNNNIAFEQEAKKLNGTFIFRVYDGPDGKDRMASWTFKQNKIVDSKYESQPAPWAELRNTAFIPSLVMRCTCPYNMMAAVNKGEMTPMRALSSPSYKLEGNKMTVMQLMRPMAMWNETCASVEVNYEFTEEDADATTATVETSSEAVTETAAEAVSEPVGEATVAVATQD